MGRVIVVTSGKGGVGKTTIIANLGIGLATMGEKVVMLDGDIGLNNLDVVMQVENKVVYDLVDCLEGKCRVSQALIQNPIIENLFVLPTSRFVSKDKIVPEDFQKIVQKLASCFDYVLIDCPAGIDKGFYLSVSYATEALVVVTPHLSSVRDADRVIGILASQNLSSINLVVNRIRGDLVAQREMLSSEEIERLMGIRAVGVIPESDNINLYSSFLGFSESLQKSSVGVAFGILARNIQNYKFSQFDYLSKYRGIFGSIRRNLKRNA